MIILKHIICMMVLRKKNPNHIIQVPQIAVPNDIMQMKGFVGLSMTVS